MGINRTTPWFKRVGVLSMLIPTIFLVGCGGGGGGSTASAPSFVPPPVPNAVLVDPGGSMAFSPSLLTLAAGETVTWQWIGSGHSVDSGTGCTSDALFNSGVLGAGATFTHTFPTPGTYPYFCGPHCAMGMTGTIAVNARNTVIQVAPSGSMTFSPDTLTIRVGQTVTWQWEASAYSESHSVTSGTACTPNGLFDSGVKAGNASFSYKFTEPGTYTYYCSVHCGMGMTGTITVNP